MKKFLFYFSLLVVFLTLLSFVYYIGANTVLADRIFPKFSLGKSGSVLSESDAKDLELLKVLPENLQVDIEGNTFSVPTSSLNPTLDYEKLKDYGKGPDIIKSLIEGVSVIGGNTISAPILIDIDSFTKQLPFKIGSMNTAYINGESIYNCQSKTYKLDGFNKNLISQKISDALKNKTELTISFTELTSDVIESTIIKVCNDNLIDISKIEKAFSSYANYENIIFPNIILIPDNASYSVFLGDDVLSNFLNKLKQSTDIMPNQGDYEIVDNKIYMYKKYSEGKILNIPNSLQNIKRWFTNMSGELSLAYDTVLPQIAKENMQILDFTKTLSEGKTRIDLYRDGAYNWQVDYALIGLIDVNKTVIQPKEEFSYIKTLAPTKDLKTKNGNYIFSGFCNSTTTIFRAALEAGFQITDRSYHAHSVDSFSWGYPLNIVDAAYFTDPVVDLKFINDLDYPILLKFSYYKDDKGFQFHTVSFLTSEKAPNRKVELNNWKITAKYSDTNYAGSFDRIVYEDNKIIRQDNFYSHYI